MEILRDPIWQGISAVFSIAAAILAIVFFVSPALRDKVRKWLLQTVEIKVWHGIITLTVVLFVGIAVGISIPLRSGDLTKNRPCDRINIVPDIKQVILPAPLKNNSDASIIYKLEAPPQAGIRILYHLAEHLVYDGNREIVTVQGRHFTHNGVYAPAGRLVSLNDGIWLDKLDIESAQKYGTVLLVQRLTFYMVSDQGIYCEKSADVQIEITGLSP